MGCDAGATFAMPTLKRLFALLLYVAGIKMAWSLL